MARSSVLQYQVYVLLTAQVLYGKETRKGHSSKAISTVSCCQPAISALRKDEHCQQRQDSYDWSFSHSGSRLSVGGCTAIVRRRDDEAAMEARWSTQCTCTTTNSKQLTYYFVATCPAAIINLPYILGVPPPPNAHDEAPHGPRRIVSDNFSHLGA